MESNPTINWKERTYHYRSKTPKLEPMPIVHAALDTDNIIAMTADETLEIIEKQPETM